MCRVRYVLAWIGLAALSIYVLACRPSFSPDGRRILLPAVDPGSSQLCVLLYDIAEGRLEPVYVESIVEDQQDGIYWPAVGWTPAGDHGVIVQQTNDGLMKVTVLPLVAGKPLRVFHVPVKDDSDDGMNLVNAPVIHGAWLFFGGAHVTRLNLATGETSEHTVPDLESVWPLQQHGRLFYLGQRKEKGAEAGRLDPASLSAEPLFTLDESLSSDMGPFVAFTGDGTGLAIAPKVQDGQKIVFLRRGQPEREVAVGSPERPLRVGNLIWAKDERSLLAAGFRDAPQEQAGEAASGAKGGVRMVLLEIPDDGGPIRETALLDTSGEFEDDAWPLFQQIALSPDGGTVATMGRIFGEEDAPPSDRALYLVDLKTAERRAKKVVIPLLREQLLGGAK